MNTTRLIQARRLFIVDNVPASTCRHNIRQWVRSVRMLGDKWLMAKVAPANQPTLAQLQQRLADCRRTGYYGRVINIVTGETLGERLELVIAERQRAAGLLPPVIGPQPTGRDV